MILGLDIGLTTGWCILEDDGSFKSWGEVYYIEFGENQKWRDSVLACRSEFRFVVAEAPLIVGASILGRELQLVINLVQSIWPEVRLIGSGMWKSSGIQKKIDLPRSGSPHMRDSFFIAQWGLQKWPPEKK